MSISRRQLKNMLIPVVVAIISIPVADTAYRLAGARPSDDLAGLFTSFGDGGFRYRENVVTSTEWFSGPFTVITDSLGLRCGSEPQTRTPQSSSVDYLVLGDSQGFGQCLDYEVTIVGRIAALAAQEGRHVANISVGGHYLKNQLEIARWLHEEKYIAMDNVIVLLTPYLISTAGQYNRAKVSSDGKLYGGEPTLVTRLAVWAKTHTAIFGRVRNAVRNVVGFEQDNSMLLNIFETGEREKQGASNLLEVLREIRDWTESIDASLIIVYTPLALELNFASVAMLAAQTSQNLDAGLPSRQTRDAAEILGLPLLNLRPALSDILEAGNPLTCRGDPHYNEDTSFVCARLIWDSLEPSSAD